MDISLDFLRECLSYDAKSGVLTWRRRPREHFATTNAWGTWNTRWAGTIAGTDTHGYRVIRLTLDGRKYKLYVHRVAFALAHGRWPDDQLDHYNRSGGDNRLSNLREATNALNCQNTGLRSDNTSGVKGVWWYRRVGKWMAGIGAEGRLHHLGYFAAFEDAVAARRAAEIALHPFRTET